MQNSKISLGNYRYSVEESQQSVFCEDEPLHFQRSAKLIYIKY